MASLDLWASICKQAAGNSPDAGYDCSFVENLPSDVQSECSICLHVLREPYLVGCCGYRFCRTCIEPIQKKAFHRCPLCNKDFSSLPDKQLERILNRKLVYCTHRGDGCGWKGKLTELEDHVNPTASPGKKAVLNDGCQFKKVECYFCKELFYRSIVKEHERMCKQEIMCTYCKTHTDTAIKMEQHYEECPMYPVSCPNDCGAKPFRKNLPKHVDDNCPLTLVDCKFSILGCEVKIARKDRSEHEDLEEHLIMAAVTINKLKEENSRLKQQVSRLKSAAPVKIKYLYVTNLPPGANEQKLKCIFGVYGSVSDITMNRPTRKRQASANVEYLLEDSAKAALRRSEEKGINLNSVRLSITPMY